MSATVNSPPAYAPASRLWVWSSSCNVLFWERAMERRTRVLHQPHVTRGGSPAGCQDMGRPTAPRSARFPRSHQATPYLSGHSTPMGKVPAQMVHRRHGGDRGRRRSAPILADAFPEGGAAPRTARQGARPLLPLASFLGRPSVEAAVTKKSLGFREVPAGRERMAGYGSFPAVLDALRSWKGDRGIALRGRRQIPPPPTIYFGAQIGWGEGGSSA